MKGRIHPVLLITLLGAGLRLYYVLNAQTTNGDGIFYSWIGQNLAQGFGYTVAGGQNLFSVGNVRMPFFPVLLSLIYRIAGGGFLVSKIFPFIFGITVIPLSYLLAGRRFDEPAAQFTALLVGLNPLLSFYSGEIMTESIYTVFLLLFIYFLTLGSDIRGAKISGALAGLSYLTRINGAALLLIALFYYLFFLRRDFTRPLVWFFLAFLLVVSPWLLWSGNEYGTLFAAEKSTAGYQYELEYGVKSPAPIGMQEYMLGHHRTEELYKGFKDGSIKMIKNLAANSFFGYYGVVEEKETAAGLKRISLFIIIFGLIISIIGLTQKKRENSEMDMVLAGVIILGILSPAWQVHLVPWPEPRYAAPLQVLLLLYLGGGLSRIYARKRLVAFVFILPILFTYLWSGHSLVGLERSHTNVSYYSSSAELGLPHDSVIITSRPEALRLLGYSNVHALGHQNFRGISDLIEKTQAHYIIIDSSSIQNQDQILLITNWFPNMVPRSFTYLGGSKHKTATYSVG